jgi:aminopeptidase N
LRRLGVQAPGTEEKLRFFSAMAAAQDPKLIAQTMQFAASGAIPNGRIPMVINTAAMMSDNPDAVWQDVQPVQADIRKHLTEDGQSFLLPAAAASSGSAVVARALVSDPASHASIGAKIAAARVADAINTRAQLQQRAAPAMAAWLKARGNG